MCWAVSNIRIESHFTNLMKSNGSLILNNVSGDLFIETSIGKLGSMMILSV